MTNPRTSFVVAASAMVTFLVTAASHAAGLGFLKETPLYYFGTADRALMQEAVQKVLADPAPNAVQEWRNPKNGYSGKAQGAGAFRSEDGLECRKLRLWLQAKGIETDSIYPVCRDKEGAWRLASGKSLTPA